MSVGQDGQDVLSLASSVDSSKAQYLCTAADALVACLGGGWRELGSWMSPFPSPAGQPPVWPFGQRRNPLPPSSLGCPVGERFPTADILGREWEMVTFKYIFGDSSRD